MHRNSDIENPDHFDDPDVMTLEEDDGFCIPDCCCPERIPTTLYPSPTSCLTSEETEELEESIRLANRLLLDLGLSGKLDEEGRRRALDGLEGHYVRITVNCDEAESEAINEDILLDGNGTSSSTNQAENELNGERLNEKQGTVMLEGKVNLVGFNFVSLLHDGKETIIRLLAISSITATNQTAHVSREPAFIDSDPCFKRELTFHFGEVVSASPELIQIFYRLPLKLYLLLFEGEMITVHSNGELLSGVVCGIEDGMLVLKQTEEKELFLNINDICYIKT
ncbi:hypothetical protein A8F94_01110 [Bacillus sp. FJAT-27225]|uniref:hypothetical protein n=1 Tax=Bacillus sp. FJAT-27225 TaxID=1743144 RepID=UPI00080C313F|nr:hypothetical protein [Bacillus sp. FJAT-27225]OCA90515.1 hypothetical protein A8F94_01110 [Bacillus sp. FJAT-27225]